jgi:hypothetical protein
MHTNTNEVITLTQNIKSMLNELQELANDHFQLNPEYITEEQVEDLQTVHKFLKATLKKAKRVSQ